MLFCRKKALCFLYSFGSGFGSLDGSAFSGVWKPNTWIDSQITTT